MKSLLILKVTPVVSKKESEVLVVFQVVLVVLMVFRWFLRLLIVFEVTC